MICPNCDLVFENEKAKFCRYCGTPLMGKDEQYKRDLEYEAKARVWRYKTFGYYTMEEVALKYYYIPDREKKIKQHKEWYNSNLYTNESQELLHQYYDRLDRYNKAFEVFQKYDLEIRKCPKCGKFHEGMKPNYCESCGFELPKERMTLGCKYAIKNSIRSLSEGKKYEMNINKVGDKSTLIGYYAAYVYQKNIEDGYEDILPKELFDQYGSLFYY